MCCSHFEVFFWSKKRMMGGWIAFFVFQHLSCQHGVSSNTILYTMVFVAKFFFFLSACQDILVSNVGSSAIMDAGGGKLSQQGKQSCCSAKRGSYGKTDDHTLYPPVCRCPTVQQCDHAHCVTESLLMEAEPQAMSY